MACAALHARVRSGVCGAGILRDEEADRRCRAAVVEAVKQAVFVVVEAVVAAPLAHPFVRGRTLLDDRTAGETEEGGKGQEVALRHAEAMVRDSVPSR